VLLARDDTLAPLLEHCAREHVPAAGVVDRLSGTDAKESEPGETEAAVGADAPMGGRRGFLLNTDGGLVVTAASVG